MIPPNVHLRRATVDDLAALRTLWQQFGFPAAELEKRLTEFQVIETVDGTMLGAVGFKLSGKHGLIHSEAYVHPEDESELRARFWERLQNLARNHGLARLWTREAAPFWHQNSMLDASADDLEKLPPSFGLPDQHWRTLQLREEVRAPTSIEAEFELFKQASQETSEKILRQARTMKFVAGLIALVFFILLTVAVVYLFRHAPSTRKFGPAE
jgi:N-acetylglutamate synthase-like GNAT family acetyltransferase